MARFFTSDWHLNSNNIIKYAHRPFLDARDACYNLMRTANSLMTCEDTLVHVGDFILVGADRHDKNVGEDASDRCKVTPKSVVAGIYANVILLSGNHDDGHNCETIAKNMELDLNHNWKNVFVCHYPSYHANYTGPIGSAQHTPVNLCGHVHDSWLVHYDAMTGVLNINVGVDVWDYKPVSDVQLTEMLDFIRQAHVQRPEHMTRKQYEEWKKKEKQFVADERARRKADSMKKKGLTPAECDRRRLEALAVKGLIDIG